VPVTRLELAGHIGVVAGGCGLAVAVIGILSGSDTFGTSYQQARGAVEGHATPLLLFIAELLASSGDTGTSTVPVS